jgi:hypothetical protein
MRKQGKRHASDLLAEVGCLLLKAKKTCYIRCLRCKQRATRKAKSEAKQRSGLKDPDLDKVYKNMSESISRLKQEIESNDATKVAAL